MKLPFHWKRMPRVDIASRHASEHEWPWALEQAVQDLQAVDRTLAAEDNLLHESDERSRHSLCDALCRQ